MEIRWDARAMFDPPREGLDGKLQSLLANEWKAPRRKYDAQQKYMAYVREPMRKLYDCQHPDSRYRFHDVHPPLELENYIIRSGVENSKGTQTESQEAQKPGRKTGLKRRVRLRLLGWKTGLIFARGPKT
jgi:hypothetical protein